MKSKRQSTANNGGVSYTGAALLAILAFVMGHLFSANCQITLCTTGGLNVNGDDDNQKEARNEKGWSTIDVFYGTTDHLEIPTSDQGRSWFSQVRQDQVVSGLLGNKTNGIFIDLAANDAVHLSNTYGLEQNLNWTGLCIEANPQYWKRLAYRQCQVVGAIVGAERDQELLFNFQDAHGGLVKRNDTKKKITKVATMTMLEIFQRYNVPKEIDYLSLDVEGAESLILMQFPLDEYRIKIMTIERLDEKGRAFLKSHGYEENVRLGAFGEGLYVHESVLASLDWSVPTKHDCKHGVRDFECARPFNVPNLQSSYA